jgi:hypothetical protein
MDRGSSLERLTGVLRAILFGSPYTSGRSCSAAFPSPCSIWQKMRVTSLMVHPCSLGDARGSYYNWLGGDSHQPGGSRNEIPQRRRRRRRTAFGCLRRTSLADEVTLGQIHDVTAQAIELWSDHLATPVTSEIQIALADLAPVRLGETHQHTILLDINANGAGWFVDPTPWEDSEFFSPNSIASGLVDMLTAVAHEMGHVLGFEHSADQYDVMADRLKVGTRRVPGQPQLASPALPVLDDVFAGFQQQAAEDEAREESDDELLDLLAFARV